MFVAMDSFNSFVGGGGVVQMLSRDLAAKLH